MKEEIKTFLVVVVSLLIITITVSTITDIKNKINLSEDTLIISGVGTIYAQADSGLFLATIITEGATVDQAISENSEKTSRVTSLIKETGVEERDLKTTSFNIYPKYDWPKELSSYPPQEGNIVGYEVRHSLEIKVRNIEEIGSLIELVTQAGVNQISNLRLVVKDEEGLKNQARKEAISKAKEKAQDLAEELEINLIKISGFSENEVMPYYNRSLDLAVNSLAGQSLQIEAGENKIEVTVYLTYKIK